MGSGINTAIPKCDHSALWHDHKIFHLHKGTEIIPHCNLLQTRFMVLTDVLLLLTEGLEHKIQQKRSFECWYGLKVYWIYEKVEEERAIDNFAYSIISTVDNQLDSLILQHWFVFDNCHRNSFSGNSADKVVCINHRARSLYKSYWRRLTTTTFSYL